MNFNEWDGVFYDAVVANAIMDRILHHAHVIPISGKSYRLKDHLKACRLIVHFYIIFFVHSVLTFYNHVPTKDMMVMHLLWHISEQKFIW